MTLKYHGTPINPVALLYQLAGRSFCVAHYDPRQVARCHEIGQSVMLDNSAYGMWQSGVATNWPAYYAWAEPWLDFPTTWAVIPDIIGGSVEENDALLLEWPHGQKGAPVWHMHEPIDRLLRILDAGWQRVCFGSSAQYATVLSGEWERRADHAWNAIAKRHRATPWIHMLRGMQCSGKRWPFASVDSCDIARNHNRAQNTPRSMADRWDGQQCPGRWEPRPEQMELGEVA